MDMSELKGCFLQKLKFKWIFSGIIVFLAFLINWLISGESSPFHDYFLWHVRFPNTWGMLNIIPFIVSAIISGNPHAPSEVIFYVGFIAQWFLIGFLLSSLISKVLID